MNRLSHRIVRMVSRIVPVPYRDEIVADLREQHSRFVPLVVALIRSGRDARRHMAAPKLARASEWLGPPKLARASEGGGAVGLVADVRGAWRRHRARPASAVAIILILAGAIGLNTAIYSMVEAVLVRPLPFADSGRVVFLWNASAHHEREPLAPGRALDFRARITAFESAAFIGHISMTVTGRGPAERWYGASVSSSFFDVVQSPAFVGRTFRTGERHRDVVVLSHRLWVDQFASDRSILGQTLVMNGRPRTVVGVMGAGFYWPTVTPETSASNPPLFWTCTPLPDVPERTLVFDDDIARNRQMGFIRMVARVRTDRTLVMAQQEAETVAAELGRTYPQTDGGRGVQLATASDQLFGPVEQPMWFVLLASALVVLGACVNAGNLILVRQSGRRRELAVRSALGAGRWRLARQLAIEAGLLAIAGGVGGVLLAMGGLRVLVAIAPESVGRLEAASISGGVLLWTFAATLVTGLMLGALSALTLWRDRTADDLRGTGTAEHGRGRLRQGLVAVEVALAVALLAGAGLFGQSLLRLQRVDVGLDANRLLTFDVMLTGERAEYQSKQLEFFNGLLERTRALPGVLAAAGAFTLPIGGDDFGASAFVEGRPKPPPGADRRIGFQIVGDQWFTTLGMRVLQGRDFAQSDTRHTPGVVIVNQALSDLEWPGTSPLGQRLKYAREDEAPVLTVVGVVSNIRHMGPGAPPRPELYLPYSQMTQPMMAVAVRTIGDPLALVPAIRAEAARVDPTQPISGINTMEAHLNRAYSRARFLATLTMLFGAVTLALAVIGVYGVTSGAVAQRTREFGVRAALGASPARLAREVLAGSLVPVWFGAVAGVAMAMWGARLIGALLFGTAPIDAWAYAAAVTVLVLTACLAGLVPARRAARVDPVDALRA